MEITAVRRFRDDARADDKVAKALAFLAFEGKTTDDGFEGFTDLL